jgi:zinc protease
MRILPKVLATLAITASVAVAQRAPISLPPRPEVPPPGPLVLPRAVYDSLPNGLRFAVVEKHDLPLVSVQLAIPGQALTTWTFDPPGKAGAFGLMLASLREGTATRSAAQISDEMLDLGTDMRFTTSPFFNPPAFVAAKSVWRPSLELFADLLVNATLPDDGVERARKTGASILDRLTASLYASRGLNLALYGSQAPPYPTSASLNTVTRADVAQMKDTYLRPQNAIVVLVGDITVAEARDALTKSFGGWQRGGVTVSSAAVTPSAPPTTIYLKDSPNARVATVVAGQLVPGRAHADGPAIDALASLLGDFGVSAGSRMYSAFRIERGLSYSPSVSLGMRAAGDAVPLYGSFTVAPALADTAVTVFLRVLRELKQDKPAQASELDFATRNLIGSLPGSLESLQSITSMVASQMRDRLPPDYLSKWVARLGSMTLPEVQAAAAKYLDPDHIAISIVADRSKVEAALRATGIPVVIVP